MKSKATKKKPATSKAAAPQPAAPEKKRVLIVDDHPFMRTGMAEVLSKEPGLSISASCGTAEEALAAIATTHPDILITDLSLPGKNGLDLVRELAESFPNIPVIVLSMHDEGIYAERCLRAGARGYLMKSEGADKLVAAIKAVLAGDIHVSSQISSRILKSFSGAGALKNTPTLGQLTEREFELFRLFGGGHSTQEIADRLGLSAKTIETHRLHIKSKLNINTAAELIAYAARWVETGELGPSGNH
jgi:DNA-binding NarL/FixJ family response regulator